MLRGALRRGTAPFADAFRASGARWISDGDLGEAADSSRPTTPWVRSVISGVDLMRNAKYNKGLAFSYTERDRLYLRGLLPPAVLSQEVQAERVLMNVREMPTRVAQLSYMLSLQERNERLFYHVLEHNVEELLPLFSYPTIGEYCSKYSLMFRSLPRGLFLSLEDRGHVYGIIKNWPERRVKAICLTDGERVGTMGDLGVQAICAPISRLALYTVMGGVDPSTCLPVTIDNGTDTERLLEDPIYVGARHRRIKGDAYFELVDEFLSAARARFGPSLLIDLEGMAHGTQTKLVGAYRGAFSVYSDVHQGLPTLALAAVLAAQRATGGTLRDQRFVLVGEGPALTAVAELLEEAVQRESRAGTVLEARQAIHLVDSKGLVVRSRADAEELDDHKLPYIQDAPECPDLLSAVRQARPTVLIGLSDGAPPWAFTREICAEMAQISPRPLLLPMSGRDPGGAPGGAELAAADAYAWTGGAAFFADYHTKGAVALPGGGTAHPSKLDTVYVFPGVGLGSLMSRSTRLREDMFVEAAKALSRLVTDEELAAGALFPHVSQARDIAAHVAAAVAQKAYQANVATELPKPPNLLEMAYSFMFTSGYKSLK